MRRRTLLVPAMLVCAVVLIPSLSRAQTWADDTAIPVSRGHWEVGLFAPIKFGLRDDIELGTHPTLMLVMPHLDAKVLWQRGGRAHFSMIYSLAYPSYLLKLIAREGTGGLLPPNTKVPQSVMLSAMMVGTVDLGARQFVTARAGGTVAPRFSSADQMPLLDFPFLYPRFAALKAVATFKLGLNYDGRMDPVAYGLDVAYFILPVIDRGYTVEQGAWVGWLVSDHFTVRLGYRLSYGRYPAGKLFSYFPFLDLLVGGG